MVEATYAIIVGLAVGIAAGAVSAFLGWNKSGEPFESRKFISGVVTGIIAGIVAVLAQTNVLQNAADDATFIISLVTIFIAVIGVDSIRTAVTGSIRSKLSNPEGVKLQEGK